ncbi:MAG: methylated-DNA-protein-cysteine methyltransferase-like protein [Glaciecola sp.]|jgi:methylated-DNA-protein-cysteine methyltransferase-like protein
MHPRRKKGTEAPPINLARERIYSVIDSIPKGRVSTYGTVGKEAGLPRGARQVAAALRHLSPGRDLPWFRILNACGKVSARSGGGESAQRKFLEREGIEFSSTGKVDLKRFGWPAGSF